MSIDSALVTALRETPGTGKVHSVFERAINILAPWGQLVTLAARQLDNAPWTVRAEVRDWSRAGIQAGDPADFSTRGISFDSADTVVLLPGAREWFAKRIPLAEITTAELASGAAALDELLVAHGVRGGILEASDADRTATEPGRTAAEPGSTAAEPGPTAFDAGIAQGLRAGREALHTAVRAGDSGAIGEAALQLLGLGSGLTPAGDDFLCGLALLAAQPGSRLGAACEALSAVVGQHADRTTLLSWTTLREAVDGRVRESLLELLSQLFRHRAEDPAGLARHLRAPVDRALGIGHTSGTDILSGLLAGLRLETELRGSM
ncbi:DUF2877 domain-containing protein [Arthrobacter celericrescens]|uniref:oxamate carbamoyltransferase subunit AllH family protein n=1 Tax=Arthrobacter celericrescens TaxID=2320851 RepID=UPI0013C43FF1|nr:DUF2877 domain-containing protein [Arthrobacter celericrescens]